MTISENAFQYRDLDNEEIAKIFDLEYPIKLKNSSLIDRIHARYPIIPKSQIALIVKTCLDTLRFQLIIGSIISIKGFMHNIRIRFLKYHLKEKSKHTNRHIRLTSYIMVDTPRKLQ